MNGETSRTPMSAPVTLATSSSALAQSRRDADAPPLTLPASLAIHPAKLKPEKQKAMDAVGLTTVHCNRVLPQVLQDGVVDFRNSLLIISSMSALAQITGFDDHNLRRRLMAVS